MKTLLCAASVSAAALTVLASVSGCSLETEGVKAPRGALNFPVALGITADSQALVVANSNFDLRYRRGSLQSFNLEAMVIVLDEQGCRDSSRVCTLRPEQFLYDELSLDSYTSDLVLSDNADTAYVSIRSSSKMASIHVGTDGSLRCGEGADPDQDTGDCFSAGGDSTTFRGLEFPADPVTVAVVELSALSDGVAGRVLLVAHRGGQISMFMDGAWDGATKPVLVDVLSDLEVGLTDVVFQPTEKRFYVSSSESGRVSRVGVSLDFTDLERSFVFEDRSFVLQGVDDGADLRAIAFPEPTDPSQVLLLSRRPESVVYARITDGVNGLQSDALRAVGVGSGPSRMVLGNVGGRALAFVSCFDSHNIYVVDLQSQATLEVMYGLNGPFDLAFDADRELLYVTDFRSSQVRIVDLHELSQCITRQNDTGECAPRTIGLLGAARPVGAL